MRLSHIQKLQALSGSLVHRLIDLRNLDLDNAVSFPDLNGSKDDAHENGKHACIKESHNKPVECRSFLADNNPDQYGAYNKKGYCQRVAENCIADQGDSLNKVADLEFYVAQPAAVDFIDLHLVKDFSLLFVEQADAVDHQAVLVVHAQQEQTTGGDHQSGGQHSLNKVNYRSFHAVQI